MHSIREVPNEQCILEVKYTYRYAHVQKNRNSKSYYLQDPFQNEVDDAQFLLMKGVYI